MCRDLLQELKESMYSKVLKISRVMQALDVNAELKMVALRM